MRKVIYIGGYGRSGSTVLALLLGQSEHAISVGELGALHRALRQGRMCTCGAEFHRCPFWGGLVPAPDDAPDHELLSRNANVTLALDHAFEHSGAKALIDSTKTSYRNFRRPWQIHRAGYDLRFIHLTRSLRAVIRSSLKGRNSVIEVGSTEPERFTIARVFISWSIANIIAYFYRIIFWKQCIKISYEDLIDKPQFTIRRIARLVDIDLSNVCDIISQEGVLIAYHEVNGNRLLRSKNIVFVRKND